MSSDRQVVDYPVTVVARGMGPDPILPAGVKTPWHGRGMLVNSSTLSGRDEKSSALPEGIQDEIAMLFRHIRGFMEAAGGGVEDILDVTFYVMDEGAHEPLVEKGWDALFPDPGRRPACHIFNAAPAGMKEERITAVVIGCVS